MFKLVIQDDEGKTTVVPLIRDEITIGRKEGNTIRLTERNVSRRHARILRNNGEVSIEDLGSYNGIRVNNARIAERVALRVSDQVQIGDYKLYLKAEGVEQVDDARTMPIERVETEKATDIMPAVAPAPTVPLAVPAPSASSPPATPALPPNTKLVGSPATTLVAVPEHEGRPIGSTAQVPALTPPTGYGRLVVVSSNFAGKEFELSRGQMIIGRTPENDVVIDHRSISRNHAKVVREPDTGRYTISDLQSANGVRVNGNDYGKVELRRGDVVDLGHVRLRYVEPGEDFVFARDAVVMDVPESGGKKGLLVALLLGVLVLAGVGVAWMMKSGGNDDGDRKATTGSANPLEVDAMQVALADAASVTPTVDVAASGSGATDDHLVIECKTALTNMKWLELSDCAARLKATNPEQAAEFSRIVEREAANEATLRALRAAVKEVEMGHARKLQAKIGEDSVYTAPAREAIEKKEQQLVASLTRELRSAAGSHDCRRYESRAQSYAKYGGSIVSDARREAGRCERVDPPRGCTASSCPSGQRCDSGKCVRVATATKPDCDPADVKSTQDAGQAAYQRGSYTQALSEFKKILRCKPGLLVNAYLAACRGHQFADAKALFPRLDKSRQNYYSQACVGEGFDPRSP